MNALHQVLQVLYYNPYFPGGAIAMPKMLADGGVEYEDGTPATEAQQAKVLDGATSSPRLLTFSVWPIC
jgi:cytochrome c1